MSRSLLVRLRQGPAPSGLLVVLVAVLVVAGLAAAGAHALDALKAAGLVGTAPGQGASSFAGLISTLQQNTVWLIATGLGLAMTLVAAMLVFGSMRAPDFVFRIFGGVALLLVVIPAVLS
jgi:hypothetical protein